MNATTFSGTVYGAIQNPRLADSFIRVLGCEDGSVAIAWGNALEHANEGDKIFYAGGGDGDNGYHVIIDYEDLSGAGEYIATTFFETLEEDDWVLHENSDVFGGLTHIGHIGYDGTLSTTRELNECGLTWDVLSGTLP